MKYLKLCLVGLFIITMSCADKKAAENENLEKEVQEIEAIAEDLEKSTDEIDQEVKALEEDLNKLDSIIKE